MSSQFDFSFAIHGNPSEHRSWGCSDDTSYFTEFYNKVQEAIESNVPNRMEIKIRYVGNKICTYYNYLIYKDVYNAGGRGGGYFGMSLRLANGYVRDVSLVYKLLDQVYQAPRLVQDELLKKEDQSVRFIYPDFTSPQVSSKLKVVNDIIFKNLGEFDKYVCAFPKNYSPHSTGKIENYNIDETGSAIFEKILFDNAEIYVSPSYDLMSVTVKKTNSRIASLETENKQLSNTVRQQTSSINHLNNELAQKDRQIERNENDIKEKTKMIQDGETKIKQQSTTISQQSSSINNLNSELVQKKRQIEKNENDIKEKDRKLSEKEKLIREQNDRLSRISRELDDLKSLAGKLPDVESAAVKATLKQMKQFVEVKQQLGNTDAQIDELRKEIQLLEAQINKVSSDSPKNSDSSNSSAHKGKWKIYFTACLGVLFLLLLWSTVSMISLRSGINDLKDNNQELSLQVKNLQKEIDITRSMIVKPKQKILDNPVIDEEKQIENEKFKIGFLDCSPNPEKDNNGIYLKKGEKYIFTPKNQKNGNVKGNGSGIFYLCYTNIEGSVKEKMIEFTDSIMIPINDIVKDSLRIEYRYYLKEFNNEQQTKSRSFRIK